MNLINKKDVAAAEIGEDGGQIARTLNDRPCRDLEIGAHLVGNDRGQGGLAQARRAVEQDVIQGFFATLSGFDENAQIVAQLVLARSSRSGCAGAGLHRVQSLLDVWRLKWCDRSCLNAHLQVALGALRLAVVRTIVRVDYTKSREEPQVTRGRRA